MRYPRLAVMDDIDDAPSPLPFPGRDADGVTGLDHIDAVLERAQSQMDELTEMLDEDIHALRLRIPGREDGGDDDDRPWAA